ncbi:MAG: S53 family peptidase, partial [Limisphaerales bacterium]
MLSGQVPSAVAGLTATGRLPTTHQLSLAIDLPLQNQAALGQLLRQLYDPRSTNFHKFLTPAEFTARFGPTEQDYQAVIKFAEANGLTVTGTHGDRVVLDVEGGTSNVEQAFHITLRTYRQPTEARDFFAPDTEPSVPTNLSVVSIEGLDDYSPPRPLMHKAAALNARPLSFNGSGPNGEYAGNDFRYAYASGVTNTGAGQSVGLLEFSAYYQLDVTNYEKIIGLTRYVPLTNAVILISRHDHGPSTADNGEVALDIEQAIAMAPGLSRVIVYEISSNPSTILSRMADDNLAKQLSCSWTWAGGPGGTNDSIFQQMAAQGQSFFQASGDSDAYTGNEMIDNSSQTNAPVDSSYVTSVGGTTLTMNGAGVSWSSETVWNWNNSGNPNVGSGGGLSTYYPIPYWQTNVSMTANGGSTTHRNIPDVALTADDVFVSYNNGDTSGTYYFGGTSCAAPLWAGFCALVNQQSVTVNGTNVGFLNPALYAIANSTNYNACFHDITTGNNIGGGTPGLYNAVTGYDLCTGLGTPNGTNLINALAPLPNTTPLITGVVAGNGSVVLSLGGAPGYTYILEATTNLNTPGGWQPVATNTLGTNGVWQFTDAQSTN